MNYIFELMMYMLENHKRPETLTFQKADNYSAYLELALEFVNESEFQEYEQIPINPYFRYHEIFKQLFVSEEYQELKQTLLDILIHINFETDRLAGMSKSTFYRIYMIEACKAGEMGRHVAEHWSILSFKEETTLGDALVEQYITGNSLSIYKRMVHVFFPKGSVYMHQYNGKEILVYTADIKNSTGLKQIDLVNELFLPLQFKVQIYWKNHFGIIDIDETMQLDQIELY